MCARQSHPNYENCPTQNASHAPFDKLHQEILNYRSLNGNLPIWTSSYLPWRQQVPAEIPQEYCPSSLRGLSTPPFPSLTQWPHIKRQEGETRGGSWQAGNTLVPQISSWELTGVRLVAFLDTPSFPSLFPSKPCNRPFWENVQFLRKWPQPGPPGSGSRASGTLLCGGTVSSRVET